MQLRMNCTHWHMPGCILGSNPGFYKVRPVMLHMYQDCVFLLPSVDCQARVVSGKFKIRVIKKQSDAGG